MDNGELTNGLHISILLGLHLPGISCSDGVHPSTESHQRQRTRGVGSAQMPVPFLVPSCQSGLCAVDLERQPCTRFTQLPQCSCLLDFTSADSGVCCSKLLCTIPIICQSTARVLSSCLCCSCRRLATCLQVKLAYPVLLHPADSIEYHHLLCCR